MPGFAIHRQLSTVRQLGRQPSRALRIHPTNYIGRLRFAHPGDDPNQHPHFQPIKDFGSRFRLHRLINLDQAGGLGFFRLLMMLDDLFDRSLEFGDARGELSLGVVEQRFAPSSRSRSSRS
jgi:hypothetical protein